MNPGFVLFCENVWNKPNPKFRQDDARSVSNQSETFRSVRAVNIFDDYANLLASAFPHQSSLLLPNGLTRKVKTKVVQPVTAVYAVQLDQEKVSGRTTQSLPVIIHIVLIYK